MLKRLEHLSERVDQQLAKNSRELAEMRELLQSCLESISTRAKGKENEKSTEGNEKAANSNHDKNSSNSE